MRTMILIYASMAYLSFLLTLTYAMGFVSNIGVPKTIDSGGPPTSWTAAVLLDAALLLVFAVQHTIMARPAFKRWVTRWIPAVAERATFVLAASAALALLMWQWRPIGGDLWRVDSSAGRLCFLAVAAAGYGIVLYSSFVIDHFELFGLRQAWLHFRGKSFASRPFVVKSVYRSVRHPLMTGFLIAFWSTPHMTVGHLVFSLLVTAYVLIGTRIEERDLVGAFGSEYEQYRTRTPGLFPRLGLSRTRAALKPAGAAMLAFFVLKGMAWLVVPVLWYAGSNS